MNYVNNTALSERTSEAPGSVASQSGHGADGYDGATIRLIELLFFAYRDFVAAPDEILARQGFGRAHHRVLHFVNRHEGLPVAELLRILKITKQSLARVLKELVAAGFVEQRTGARDRRQRLLHTTAAGRELALKLAELQARRVRHALEETLPALDMPERFLFAMIDAQDRPEVARLIGLAPPATRRR